MKKTAKNIVSIIIALTVVILSTMTAFAYDEEEFNGRFYDANPINVGEEVFGTITDSYDKDYFWFTIPSDGYVTVTANHVPGTKVKGIAIFSYDGSSSTEFLYRELNSGVESVTTPKLGLEGGKYYIRISGVTYDVAYSFTVNFTPADNWEKEINDSLAYATPMEVGKTFYGAANVSTSEHDWYKFTIDETQMVSVKVGHTYGSDNTTVYLYSYDGNSTNSLTHTTVARNSDFGSTEAIRLTSGTYYARITAGNRQEYSLEVIASDPASGSDSDADTAPEENTRPNQPVAPTAPEAEEVYEDVTTEYYEENTDNVDVEDTYYEDGNAETDEYYEEETYDEYYDYGYDSSPSVSPIVLIIIISAAVVIIAAVCIVIVFVVKKK